jgi:hypothetical protein
MDYISGALGKKTMFQEGFLSLLKLDVQHDDSSGTCFLALISNTSTSINKH